MGLEEIILRVLAGGIAVSMFAALGEIIRPKSFAGLSGSAPSIVLATISLTVMKDGSRYAAIEAKSMILGAIGFIAYEMLVSKLLIWQRDRVLPVVSGALLMWFAVAFGLWYAMGKIAG